MHCNQGDCQQELVSPPYNVNEGTGNVNGEASSTNSVEAITGNGYSQTGDPNYHASFWEYAADFGWNLVRVNGMAGIVHVLQPGQSGLVEECGLCHIDKPVKSIWNFGSGN